jgi:hypothetical protein
MAELKKEFGFEIPRPTRCTFPDRPWQNGQEVRITTKEAR